jgi:NAD(P)-dependent dehydrogenase (short-subunit alcohol dehydrogenase family)
VLTLVDRDAAAGEALQRKLAGEVAAGGSGAPPPVFAPADVTDERAMEGAIAAAADRAGGHLHVLVNNAAAFVFGEVTQVTVDAWRRALDVNVIGYALAMKHAIPRMPGSGDRPVGVGGGAIVNLSSISAFLAQPGFVPYSTTKGAILVRWAGGGVVWWHAHCAPRHDCAVETGTGGRGGGCMEGCDACRPRHRRRVRGNIGWRLFAVPNAAHQPPPPTHTQQMTRNVAMDVGKRGIRANSVCPGPILTTATAKHAASQGKTLVRGGATGRAAAVERTRPNARPPPPPTPAPRLQDDIVADMAGHLVLKRMGHVDEVAKAVLWLASDDASYVTGSHVMVDGGYAVS